jgi:hypothetical protein
MMARHRAPSRAISVYPESMRRLATALLLCTGLTALGCSGGSGDGDDDGGTTGTTDPTTNGDTTTGEVDNCTGGAPLPPPFCDKPTCYHDCGCEECEPDQINCVEYDDALMQECSSDGTCVTDTPCAEGKHCIPQTATSGRCSETYSCDELQELYDKQMGRTSCANDDQCQVLAGACDVGLGVCWHAVNPQAKVEILDELEANWIDKSCGTDTCGGDCGAMPTAKCIDNTCTLE